MRENGERDKAERSVYTMPTVLDAAQYILERTTHKTVSLLRLERLCYYAQGWNLAWDDEPIFQEDFYANQNGPVCYELLDGVPNRFSITKTDMIGDSDALTDEQKGSIDAILEYYEEYSTNRLGDLVRFDQPWKIAYENGKKGRGDGNLISKRCMKQYYQKML